MNLESRRMFAWLCAGSLSLAACSKKDDGVGVTLPGQDKDSENEEAQKSEDSDSGAPEHPSDASLHDPAEAEVVVIEPPDATCAATSQEAKQVTTTKEVVVETKKDDIKPVAIYLMVDRSSSMIGVGCNTTTNPCSDKSWSDATQAITQFVNDPASAQLDVALGYFPPTISDTDKTEAGPLCSGASCAKAAVPIDNASRNAGKIADSLAGAVPPGFPGPYNYTPTGCALRGLAAFCKDHKMRTGQKCVGVLVTDGLPMGGPGEACVIDTSTLTMHAMTAAMEGTPVFTLGLNGANFNFLDTIATAGGTDCRPSDMMHSSCDATAGKDAFIAALNAIRETVKVTETHIEKETVVTEEPIDCEWTIPPPPMDQKFDPKKVNVRFSATGKDARTLGKTTKDECAMFPEGWHYDDEDKPAKVLACNKACDEIKASMGAKISIELGCQTELIK